jgi:hypothetical protein
MAVLFAPASFRFVRGTRWDDSVTLTDKAPGLAVDLTTIVGITMRLRRTYSGPIIAELSVAAGTLVVLDAAAGKIAIRCDSAFTYALPENGHRKARYLYDAIIERVAGDYEPAIKGRVTAEPQITYPQGTT